MAFATYLSNQLTDKDLVTFVSLHICARRNIRINFGVIDAQPDPGNNSIIHITDIKDK